MGSGSVVSPLAYSKMSNRISDPIIKLFLTSTISKASVLAHVKAYTELPLVFNKTSFKQFLITGSICSGVTALCVF